MKLLAYLAAFGYSNQSPKFIINPRVPYTSRPINAKIPSGVPPKTGTALIRSSIGWDDDADLDEFRDTGDS
jgi:hypothetical protein